MIDRPLRNGDIASASLVPKLRCEVAQHANNPDEDGLSTDFLRHYCSVEDLTVVRRLEIQVDAVTQNVETLGMYLPNLRQLKLADSSIMSVRDLGTSLQHLEVLWMSRCGLQDLSGSAALPALREFYLPFNDVTDLAPLGDHESLEVLDIEGNAVGSLEEIETLIACPKLHELTINGNPVCKGQNFSREAVLKMLPGLAVLDDIGRDEDANATTCTPRLKGVTVDEDDEDTLSPESALELLDLGVLPLSSASGNLDTGARRVGKAFDDEYDVGGSSDEDYSSAEEEFTVPHPRPSAGEPAAVDRLQITPLQPTHPLLAKGLQDEQDGSSTLATQRSDLYSSEPDEFQLVLERLKRARLRPAVHQHAFTARPAVGASSSFAFQVADRRKARTADAVTMDEANAYRPATAVSCGLRLDEFRGAQDSASSLTCGDGTIAGNPISAARKRRQLDADAAGAEGASTFHEEGLEIRELLRRYQTYTQQSCLPPEELKSRKLEADSRRPCTPDVRIRSSVVDLRPGSSSGSRPGSSGWLSAGLRPGSGSGRPGSSGLRPGSSHADRVGSASSASRGAGLGGAGVGLGVSRGGGYNGTDVPPRLPPSRSSSDIPVGAFPSPTLKTKAGEALILDDSPELIVSDLLE